MNRDEIITEAQTRLEKTGLRFRPKNDPANQAKNRADYLKEFREKNKRFSLTLNVEEVAILERQAKVAGMSPTTYLKQVWLMACEDEKRYPPEVAMLLKRVTQQVARVGNNLNQLTKKTNEQRVLNVFNAKRAKEQVFEIFRALQTVVADLAKLRDVR